METMNTGTKIEGDMLGTPAEEQSRIKQKLGAFGRRIKHIDLRSRIVTHPMAAVGIAAGVGALLGLARPMPKRGPLGRAMMAMLSTVAFKYAREAAFTRLASYAKQKFDTGEPMPPGFETQAPQAGMGP
jgi:hypothetical protein